MWVLRVRNHITAVLCTPLRLWPEGMQCTQPRSALEIQQEIAMQARARLFCMTVLCAPLCRQPCGSAPRPSAPLNAGAPERDRHADRHSETLK